MIKLGNINISYRGDNIEKAKIDYRATYNDEGLRGNGTFTLNAEEYHNNLSSLQDVCKEHFLNKIDELDIEILNVNKTFTNNVIDNVNIRFKGNSDNGELNVNGKYKVDTETYEEGKTVQEYKEMAAQYIRELAEQA
jgi:hypothetical protein